MSVHFTGTSSISFSHLFLSFPILLFMSNMAEDISSTFPLLDCILMCFKAIPGSQWPKDMVNLPDNPAKHSSIQSLCQSISSIGRLVDVLQYDNLL